MYEALLTQASHFQIKQLVNVVNLRDQLQNNTKSVWGNLMWIPIKMFGFRP